MCDAPAPLLPASHGDSRDGDGRSDDDHADDDDDDDVDDEEEEEEEEEATGAAAADAAEDDEEATVAADDADDDDEATGSQRSGTLADEDDATGASRLASPLASSKQVSRSIHDCHISETGPGTASSRARASGSGVAARRS
jgi:hypothetical protein